MATLILRQDQLGRAVKVSEYENENDALEEAAKLAMTDKGTKYTVRGEQGELVAEYSVQA